jgi:hypothetical protein
MHDLIEGMAIAFSFLMIFGIVSSFIVFMWFIGRKERMVIEEYGKKQEIEHE